MSGQWDNQGGRPDPYQITAMPRAPSAAERWGFRPHHAGWIEAFVRAHGRAPRVLGIGNIANNAFKNALLLRQHGIECDVLCYSYYHIMGCPEWEAAYFDSRGVDDFKPDWSKIDLGGYERPRWFAQGHLGTCLDYLIAFREGELIADTLWKRLEGEHDSGGAGEASSHYAEPIMPYDAAAIASGLAQLFRCVFPQRRDILEEGELLAHLGYFLGELPRFKRLFANYDVVIGYSTDGTLPLIAGKRNYIAYEHGTIREIPFRRDVVGRLCALVYARARTVLITNCDNIVAAQRLGLRRFAFVPHPILEDQVGAVQITELRQQLCNEHDADFIVLHPSRQHWSDARDPNYDKGNDILIRGFARFVSEQRPKALLILVEWGQMVADTRALINELGIAHRVIWLNPIPVRLLAEYVAASDVLADQFTIGAWGATMPLGLLVGTPTLIRLDEEVHRWCFPEMPPVLNAVTPDEVLGRLVEIQDRDRAAAVAAAGKGWYERYHSMSVVAGRLVDAISHLQQEEDVAAFVRSQEFVGRDISDKEATELYDRGVYRGLLDKKIGSLRAEVELLHNYITTTNPRYEKLWMKFRPSIWGRRYARTLLQAVRSRFASASRRGTPEKDAGRLALRVRLHRIIQALSKPAAAARLGKNRQVR